MASSEDHVKKMLESVVGQRENERKEKKDVRLADKIEEHRKSIVEHYPDYMEPEEITVIPEDYAPKAKVANKEDCGKGCINEWAVRYLLLQPSSKSTLKYFVVHDHSFNGYFSKKPKQEKLKLLIDAWGEKKIVPKDKNLPQCESDFILLHPKKGIIFIEVYGADTNTDSEKVSSRIREKWEQGLKMCLALKAYVIHILRNGKRFKNEIGLKHPEVEKQLDHMFDKFARFAVLPSFCGKDLPKKSQGTAPIEDSRFTVLFNEDCQGPDKFKAYIEKGFLDIQDLDQKLYQVVYDLALSCCILMRPKIVANGLRQRDPKNRELVRDCSLKAMDYIHRMAAEAETSITLSKDQGELVDSKEKIRFVEGIAGSGKTLICFKRMLKLSDTFPNEKILYICFRKYLAEHVRELVQKEVKERETEEQRRGMLENIDVMDYEGFCGLFEKHGELSPKLLNFLKDGTTPEMEKLGKCVSVLNSEDVTVSNREDLASRVLEQCGESDIDSGFLQEEISREAERIRNGCWVIKQRVNLIKELSTCHHVLIDEYHRFSPFIRKLLEEIYMEKLIKEPFPNGSFWVFYDNEQHDSVDVRVPHSLFEKKLDTVYRCSHQIAQYFMKFSRRQRTYKMGHEYGSQGVETVEIKKNDRVCDKVVEVIDGLKRKEGYKEEDITILLADPVYSKNVADELSQTRCKVLRLSDFEGIGSKVVIFVSSSVHDAGDGIIYSEYYTAASRARWKFICVTRNKQEAEVVNNHFPNLNGQGNINVKRAKEILKIKDETK